jgi:BirA family biotin operon repressor/biotin-[acetyl-CoA-carboxylase] ligase
VFDQQLFKEKLNTSWLGRNFQYVDKLESTNTYAKKLKSDESLHGCVVLTEHQTGGRGQYQRFWYTQAGLNLTFSLIFEPKSSDRFTVLTLACALAVAEVCEELTGKSAPLKWPNDVLFDGRKICGLLTELIHSGNEVDRAVIGIGLNVNQVDFPAELAHSATSIYQHTKEVVPREKLLSRLLTKIEYYYRLWDSFDIDLIKKVNKRLLGYGLWSKLEVNGEDLPGEFKFLGVNESGALLVLNKDLEVNTFSYEQVRVQFDSTAG